MFLNHIKKFWVKKTLNKKLQVAMPFVVPSSAKTIGLIVDGIHFLKAKVLIKELIAGGFIADNIVTIKLTTEKNNQNNDGFLNLEYNQLQWDGAFKNPASLAFLSKNYDVLISYYDTEDPILMQLTYQAQACLKIGFASVDLRLNQFSIQTVLANYDGFVSELLKILKLLNIK